MMTPKQILSTHGLRQTASREEVLNIFFAHKAALSQPEIEKELKTCDRVTIYRTLATYLEKGILHKVLDDAGAMKYALCADNCGNDHYHSHDHVHFKCNVCGNTTCVEDIHIPPIQLPQGFKVSEVNTLIQGICPTCQ